MTRVGRYLSPDHYKSRYNLYAGDMESPHIPSTDFMQPKLGFCPGQKFSMKEERKKIYVLLSSFLLIDHRNKTGSRNSSKLNYEWGS